MAFTASIFNGCQSSAICPEWVVSLRLAITGSTDVEIEPCIHSAGALMFSDRSARPASRRSGWSSHSYWRTARNPERESLMRSGKWPDPVPTRRLCESGGNSPVKIEIADKSGKIRCAKSACLRAKWPTRALMVFRRHRPYQPELMFHIVKSSIEQPLHNRGRPIHEHTQAMPGRIGKRAPGG